MVALYGVGHMSAPWKNKTESARVFYMAVTEAKQRLVMEEDGDGSLCLAFSKSKFN